MNRRKFIALTGITIGLPSLSYAEKKPQWIKLLERQPKVGQKIILINRYNHSYQNYDITGGIVKELDLGLSDKHQTALIHIEVDFMRYGQYPLTIGVASVEGKEVIKSRRWLNLEGDRKFEIYTRNNNSIIHTRSYYLTNYYWLPVKGEYPIDIPPFPKCVDSWIPFNIYMPKHNDNIEIKDQTGITAIGWYQESKIDKDYCWFMPNEQYKEWLKINLVSINKPFWSWRYV